MPRLNSLNHEPGVSFGQLDILTYQKHNEKRVNKCATVLISEQRFVNMVNDAASKTPFKITRLLHEHLSYPCGFLIWVDARFSTCGEVAEHFDGVSCAALIWINPVFTWETEKKCDKQPLRRNEDSFGLRATDAKKEGCYYQLVQSALSN